ncbi:MAG: electron transport complex subunit E [Lachnospiraceae bacterium]|nr:electron transport complex subunit E [Lachnospiraceae bacterium]
MNFAGERLYNGIIKENPTFVLMLGMCPTMAVTTSGINAIGMGLSTTAVLVLSNLVISLLRKVIPDKVRIPAFIVIIASFVTIVQMLMQAYVPDIYAALGIYIPLIVVNCIILGRAEAWAYSNGPLSSFFDGLGMGLGFTAGITCIGLVRELIGAGELFSHRVMPAAYEGAAIFVMAPGAFFVLAFLVALMNKLKVSKKNSGCGMDCAECGGCDK